MNKYTIVSVCVGDSFFDAFNITVPSWFKEGCEKIVVYTDREFSYPGVEIRPELPAVDNWIDAVGLKAIAMRAFLRTFESGNIAFLDMDNYLVEDIGGIYDENFSLAVCQKHGSPTAACGTWFGKVLPVPNCRLRGFINDWCILQGKYYLQKKMVQPHKAAYDQLAFTELLPNLSVYYAPNEVWCSRRTLAGFKDYKWKEWLKNHPAKVLHFVGGKWRDKQFVEEMAKIAGEFKYGNPS